MLDTKTQFWEYNERKQSERILKLISQNGTKAILSTLEKKPLRFSQLMFKTMLNPSILDRRLKSLIQYEIVRKDKEKKYVLTPKGEKLVEILKDLLDMYQQI